MADQIDCSCEEILSDGKLPGDVMVIILSNLPVKSLLKFKSVSKPWCSLISSPRFIKLHLHRQSVIANNNNLLMSLDDWENCIFGVLNLTHNPNRNIIADSEVVILESPPLLSSKETTLFIVDSCNGLVCVHSVMFAGSESLILWNPATRKYRSVEPLKGDNRLSFSTLGLCYVEATNDFKLVGWTRIHIPIDNRPRLLVYSLSSGSWMKSDCCDDAEKFRDVFGPPTFMSGCMHWLANTCICSSSSSVCTCNSTNVVASYNVTDGVMSCFSVPDDCGHHPKTSRHSLVIRGCFSIVLSPKFDLMESGFEVWVMEEYGVEGSWIKRFYIQGSSRVMVPLISWNDGEIIFISETDVSNLLIFHDPYSKNAYYLEFTDFYVYKVFNYVESLASVQGEEEIAPYELIEV